MNIILIGLAIYLFLYALSCALCRIGFWVCGEDWTVSDRAYALVCSLCPLTGWVMLGICIKDAKFWDSKRKLKIF
jgi:hypothetical protein